MSATAAPLHTYRSILTINGAAISLSGIHRSATRTIDSEGLESAAPFGLWLSSGSSTSGEVIQQSVRSVWAELSRWLIPQWPTLEDVESEVAVLLPPKSRRIVTVHVRHFGRAEPLLYVDDVLREPDFDGSPGQ